MKGKFIVIYGSNNLGKSAQSGLLADRLHRKLNGEVLSIKYPIYTLPPTGPRINAILRNGLPVSDFELQKEFVQNRRDFEPQLMAMLRDGKWIVAEDYKGTGIAWGITRGMTLSQMEELNNGLYPEDLAVLLDGERFTGSIEREHRYEGSNDWQRNREIHLQLADRYGWKIVNASQSIEKVTDNIWQIVEKHFF